MISSDPHVLIVRNESVHLVDLASIRKIGENFLALLDVLLHTPHSQHHFFRIHLLCQLVTFMALNIKTDIITLDISKVDDCFLQTKFLNGIVHHIIFAGVYGGGRQA